MFIILTKSPRSRRKGAAGARSADDIKKQQTAKIWERIAIPVHTESTQSIAPYWRGALRGKSGNYIEVDFLL